MKITINRQPRYRIAIEREDGSIDEQCVESLDPTAIGLFVGRQTYDAAKAGHVVEFCTGVGVTEDESSVARDYVLDIVHAVRIEAAKSISDSPAEQREE